MASANWRGAVVAVDHGHRGAVGGGDHVDLPVHAQGLVGDDHGEVRGTGGHIAGVDPDGVGGGHAGARVALAGGHGDARLQGAAGIQEAGARLGQGAGALARRQDPGQDVAQLPAHAGDGVELLHHGLVIVHLLGVDGEHAGGLAHAHDVQTREHIVDVARQGGQPGDVADVGFFIEDGLIQVGDAPALGNIEAEQGRQLFGGLAGDGVAPGAELRQLLSVGVEGQVAVHHGGNANGAHGGELLAEFLLHVPLEIGEAGLQARVHRLHGVGPDAVYKLIFPFIAAAGDGQVVAVQQDRLDPGRAELDAKYGLFKIHGSFLTFYDLRRSADRRVGCAIENAGSRVNTPAR